MKIVYQKAEKDPNTGKNKIMIEIDEDDVVILGEVLRSFEQSGKLEHLDNKFKNKLKHNKEQLHKAFTIVRPS